jgi:hypothetical protein
MNWNKVNLRAKEKNLPKPNQRVLWATTEGAPSKNVFHKFMGCLTTDGKHIDTGLQWYKVTSNFWWVEVTDPEIQ